jgi:hypothetical protein
LIVCFNGLNARLSWSKKNILPLSYHSILQIKNAWIFVFHMIEIEGLTIENQQKTLALFVHGGKEKNSRRGNRVEEI